MLSRTDHLHRSYGAASFEVAKIQPTVEEGREGGREREGGRGGGREGGTEREGEGGRYIKLYQHYTLISFLSTHRVRGFVLLEW